MLALLGRGLDQLTSGACDDDPASVQCVTGVMPPDDAFEDTCPECGEKGQSVERLTLKALLCPNALARLEAGGYRFCPTHACEVVYFGEEAVSVYHQADLKVRGGRKQTDDLAPVCYCFGHTIGSLRQEINKTGASSVVASITAHIQAGRCGCDVNNPSGHCCLGEVSKVVKRLLP